MRHYDPKTIEAKWQDVWSKTKLYEVEEDASARKSYITAMFPYPSGAGLHVGHVRNYSITDTLARYHRQRGENVLSTIGWDAFGLPAENYAIKTGTPPKESTDENIKSFKSQLMRLGMSYDWSREINTTDPEYYRWTQWIFTKLHEKGLAYQDESLQWWCPECKTVLANEQVENGCCWRHEDTPAEKKRLMQWFFKITEYADELLDGIDELDWPERIKSMQRNWIGRSEGALVKFPLSGSDEHIEVFTTRPDTLHGATYMVLAPEHPLVDDIAVHDRRDSVADYKKRVLAKSDVERVSQERDKTGVFTGAYAVNPVSDEKIPIWVADFVLMSYGTGAIMAVPAHDVRDYEFAKEFKLPMRRVVEGGELPYTGTGKIVNSPGINGMDSKEAVDKIIADLRKQELGDSSIQYKMRDWLISRQRYWGTPIPIIHCGSCGPVAVPQSDLPVVLPEVENFTPTGGSKSVLAELDEWVKTTCPECGGPGERETDTMDGYACSSWYYLRYTDAHNSKVAWDPRKANYWMPVDYYCGGDHAVSHLLYSRFWMHFFADEGLVEHKEPVKRLVFNGYINASDGSKMSKSKGNVIDPLELIDAGYGADSLRLYELFIAPYELDAAWDPNGIVGTYRFLNRVWNLTYEFIDSPESVESDNTGEHEMALNSHLHSAIRKTTHDLDRLSFNTAIASLMELTNNLYKTKEEFPLERNSSAWRDAIESLLLLLAPFAPHIAEELWSELGHEESIHIHAWPKWDEQYLQEDLATIILQVNGKLRDQIVVAADISDEELKKAAKNSDKIARYLDEGELVKTIVVPGKLVNFVIRN